MVMTNTDLYVGIVLYGEISTLRLFVMEGVSSFSTFLGNDVFFVVVDDLSLK